jgi:LmbE family N-acetylglucosaminyl deacetylase
MLAAALWRRTALYRLRFHYNLASDYQYNLEPVDGAKVAIFLDRDGFIWPQAEGDTVFLRITISADLIGRFFDPSIDAARNGARARHYFERGARGVRYVNLSGIARTAAAGERVNLRGRHLHFAAGETELFFFRNEPLANRKVLIIAPHPDDAEISAFGVYSSADSFITTITAGDLGCARFRPIFADPLAHAQASAELRAWDSIVVPRIGGIEPTRAVNLGYFDGKLSEMRRQPDREVCDGNAAGLSVQRLRQFNLANILPGTPKPTWNSLIDDLVEILRRIEPEVIVMPFPALDDHPDHRAAAFAVCEALQKVGPREGKLYLYTTHPESTSLYPFGPADGAITLPPCLGKPIKISGVVSLDLNEQQRSRKYLALEAMHDLRDLPRVQRYRLLRLARFIAAELQGLLTSMDLDPASFFRRAVRPNELFLVLPFSRAEELLSRE